MQPSFVYTYFRNQEQLRANKMITTASAIITGLVLTLCDMKTEQCEIYIPATYESKTVELGKELCRADFRKYVNEAMQDDKYYVDDAKCEVLTERN